MSFAQLRYQFIVSFTPTDEPSSGLPGVGGLFDMKVGVPGEFFFDFFLGGSFLCWIFLSDSNMFC